jgi:hypothetical protein
MDSDPMIDDEVGVHTRVTVLAYWKFESVSLQRRVNELSVPLDEGVSHVLRHNLRVDCAQPILSPVLPGQHSVDAGHARSLSRADGPFPHLPDR